jgi:hypothetical protein
VSGAPNLDAQAEAAWEPNPFTSVYHNEVAKEHFIAGYKARAAEDAAIPEGSLLEAMGQLLKEERAQRTAALRPAQASMRDMDSVRGRQDQEV